MKATARTISFVVIVVSVATLPLSPQTASPTPPILIGIDGWAQLNGVAVLPGLLRLDLKAGDTLRTGWGRAGIELAPRVSLKIGERSAIRVAAGRNGENRIDLLEGTVVFNDSRRGSEGRSSAVLAHRDVQISSPKTSSYRVDTNLAQLRVRSGEVLVESGGRRIEVGKGRTLRLDGSLAVGKFRQSEKAMPALWLSEPVGYSMPKVAAKGPPAAARSPYVFFTFTGGPVYLDGTVYWQSGQEPPGIAEQDTLRTTQGQAEIRLNPYTHLFLGDESAVRMIAARSPDFAFELMRGTVVLRAAQRSSVIIGRGGEKVSFLKPGLYRLDAEPAELRVFAGQAVVESGGRRLNVGAGKRAALAGAISASAFDPARTDVFGLWPAWQAAHRRTPPWGPSVCRDGTGLSMGGPDLGSAPSICGWALSTPSGP